MSTRTKEEELALDEKIARIQRKNEEILRRQKIIEEDKRLAEKQNAIVKLRPSSSNVSRERMPALKPSNRELRHDITEDFEDPPPMQRSPRDSFRGRGGERMRSQGDWKVSGGPPRDPRSFLYDDERDIPLKDDVGPERGWRDDREIRDNRDNFRGGGRDFESGRRRGGMEHREERGRRGGGRRRNEEDEWRAERMKIDEARIQRQRAADGKWRREWDNDKQFQEPLEEPRQETRKFTPPQPEKWSPPSQYHGAAKSTPKPQRQSHGTRGRLRSQTSYSSQSDDDSPRDRGGRRPRSQKERPKKSQEEKNQADLVSAKTSSEQLPVQNKPPLPPFRAEHRPLGEVKGPIDVKDGDESWEDVTTSGTESMSEDISSVNSSPSRKTIVNTMIISGKQDETMTTGLIQSGGVLQNQPVDEDVNISYEEYFKQLEISEAQQRLEDSIISNPELLQDIDSASSSFNISLDTSDNILLAGISTEGLTIDQGELRMNEVQNPLDSTVLGYPELLQDIDPSSSSFNISLDTSDNILLAGMSTDNILLAGISTEGLTIDQGELKMNEVQSPLDSTVLGYPELLQDIDTSSSSFNISLDTSDNFLLAGELQCVTNVSGNLILPELEEIVHNVPKNETIPTEILVKGQGTTSATEASFELSSNLVMDSKVNDKKTETVSEVKVECKGNEPSEDQESKIVNDPIECLTEKM